jgi:hypothetical protein
VVPLRRQRTRTVASALRQNKWIRDLLGPLTVPVLMQYLSLRNRLQDVNLDNNILDQIMWRWCPSGCYSSKSAYLTLFNGQTGMLGTKEAWKIRAPNEVRFFIWLAVQNRCWIAERLHRHGVHSNSTCALCDQQSETIDHLLLACVVSRQVWFTYLAKYGWQHLSRGAEQCVSRMVDL